MRELCFIIIIYIYKPFSQRKNVCINHPCLGQKLRKSDLDMDFTVSFSLSRILTSTLSSTVSDEKKAYKE